MLHDPEAQSPSGRAAAAAEAIGLASVSMSFEGRQGPVEALRDINLSIPANRFISIVGRSGCGKSTLLRIVSGLIAQSSGTVRVLGKPTAEYQKQKKFGFVFQEASLFPWKTARDNVRLPLDVIGIGTRAEREARADDLLKLTRLEGFADHYPAQLSGGMRQRVSIARALSYEPEILLMDEPFGALDEFTRREMHDELIRIWKSRPVTVVFVTHSLSEALYLSDSIVVMAPRPGRIKAVVPVAHPRAADPEMRHHPDVIAQTRELESLIHEQ